VKSFDIPKKLVWEAYQRVKQNKGSSGVDGVSIERFENNLKANLYKLWNRLSSGSYYPLPVKMVEIPKKCGGKRALGIPTVADRIAQMVVTLVLTKSLEPHFDEDSFGYRPNKSAIDAVRKARDRCWKKNWAIDVDVKGFFD
jgi:RNA-directed DNA polymerase